MNRTLLSSVARSSAPSVSTVASASTNASSSRSFSSTQLRPKKMMASSSSPFDITNMAKEPFTFPLTRHNLLLQEHRRLILYYLRLETLQFSSLVNLRQKFVKPTARQFIKLRSQHYQGEPHPADRKAVITVPLSSLFSSVPPSSAAAVAHKFKLIAGPRWDSEKDHVKISCELFPTLKMNEKWCSDTLDKMLLQANDMADPMADIPLDTRPTDARVRKSRAKKIVTLRDFPAEWLASPAPTSSATTAS